MKNLRSSRGRRLAVPLAALTALTGAVVPLATTSTVAAAAAEDVPREPIQREEITLSVETPDGTVLAWTGSGDQVDLREYETRAAAQAAGLTKFRAWSIDSNGWVRISAVTTGGCLALVGDGNRAGALLDANRCRVPSSNFRVQDGRLVSAEGWQVSNEKTAVRGFAKDALTITQGRGADFGFEIDEEAAVPPVDFEVIPPSDDEPSAVLRGSTPFSHDIVVHDARGARLATATTDRNGFWQTSVGNPPKGVASLDVLVTAVTPLGKVAYRSWGTISYGEPISADAPEAVVSTGGTAALQGRGEPGSRVEVVSGGTADPTTVSSDGVWKLVVRPEERRSQATVLVRMQMRGGAETSVPVTLTRHELDADVVFPADPTEPAYVEGEALPGATVEVVSEDEVVGSSKVRPNGYFQVPMEAPDSDGEHEVTIVVKDGDSELARQEETIDFGEPVRITSPSPGDDFSNGTVTGVGEPGAEVEITDGDTTRHALVGPDGSWSVDFAPVAARPFALSVPSTLSFTKQSRPALHGTGNPGATVRFQPDRDDPEGASETTVRQDGTWRFSGTELNIAAVDDAGGAKRYDALLVQDRGADDERRLDIRLEGVVRNLEVTSPEAGSTVTADRGFVTFTGTGTPGDVVSVRASETAPLRATNVRADGTWKIGDVLFAVGEHTVRVFATGGSEDVTFTVESDAATRIDVVEPTPGANVFAVRDGFDWVVPFRGTAAASAVGAVVDLRDNRVYGFTTDALGAWSLNVPLRKGRSTVRVIDGVSVPVEFGFVTVYER